MDKYFKANKKYWDALTSINKNSEFYDLKKFLKGKTSLKNIELDALGNVEGKSILHLQCHFGMDSLSLARMGANVTGVDFSDEAINLAKSLNSDLKLNAEFICSNIYDLKDNLNKKFDIVFTSYGVIGWLPDLDKWAKIISYFLKPNCTFFIVEFHPVIWMFDDNFKKIKYSYFNKKVIKEEITGSYADRNSKIKQTEYGWNHSLSEVISSLIKNDLKILSFNEYDYSAYNCFNNMIEEKKDIWKIKGYENILPLMFSIKAEKKKHHN